MHVWFITHMVQHRQTNLIIWWVLGIIVNDILKKYFSFKIILKYFLFLYF
jgi:hypothetical protein